MNKKILFLMISIFIILAANAFAQGVVQDILSSIAGEKFDITEIYNKYGMFIDMVIYLVLFMGVSMMALGKKFKDNKSVVIAVGLVLAIGLAVWGNQGCTNTTTGTTTVIDRASCNFSIVSFGPLAGAIFALLIFVAVYELIKTLIGSEGMGAMKKKGWPAIIAIVVVWYMLQAVAPKVLAWIIAIPIFGPILKAIIGILLILAIVGVVILVKEKIK